jgi:hypothetical protein
MTSSKNLTDKVQSRQYKVIKMLFYKEILKESQISNKLITGTSFLKSENIINFMFNHNLKNYSQIAHYHLITFIAKQKVLYLSTDKNRFNIGFKIKEVNGNDLLKRFDTKLIMPYYSKTIGQMKINYRAAIVWNIIKVDILASFLNLNIGRNTYIINHKYINDYVSKILDFKHLFSLEFYFFMFEICFQKFK